MVAYHKHLLGILLGSTLFFSFFPAKASSIATAADATNIAATTATIANVPYVFISIIQSEIKAIPNTKDMAATKILPILSDMNLSIFRTDPDLIMKDSYYIRVHFWLLASR